MTSTFKTAALLLPLHLAPHPAALALAARADPHTPVHWMLPGDDPALSALALVESLTSGNPAAPPHHHNNGSSSDAASAEVAAQRLEEVAGWEAVAASAAALPGLRRCGEAAHAELIAAAGGVQGLAAAGAGQLLQWCGGDRQLAGGLAEFFGQD
jgi:hypothetical protein